MLVEKWEDLRTDRENLTLNELCFDQDMNYDQTCYYGCRFGSHGVYCHNKKWEDAPMKCRRTWTTGGDTKDEDCAGFKENKQDG